MIICKVKTHNTLWPRLICGLKQTGLTVLGLVVLGQFVLD